MNIYVIISLILLIILGYFRNKQAKNKVVRVTEENCTGCQKCVKRCGHSVLEIIKDEKGKCVMVKNPGKCTACGNCVVVCKFKALEMVNRKQAERANTIPCK